MIAISAYKRHQKHLSFRLRRPLLECNGEGSWVQTSHQKATKNRHKTKKQSKHIKTNNQKPSKRNPSPGAETSKTTPCSKAPLEKGSDGGKSSQFVPLGEGGNPLNHQKPCFWYVKTRFFGGKKDLIQGGLGKIMNKMVDFFKSDTV